MKHINLFFLTLCILSCTKPEKQNPEPEPVPEDSHSTSVTLYADLPQTKISYDAEILCWEQNDSVAICQYCASSESFNPGVNSISRVGNTSGGCFKGILRNPAYGNQWYAISPLNHLDSFSSESSVASVSLPSCQTGLAEDFGDILIMYTSKLSVESFSISGRPSSYEPRQNDWMDNVVFSKSQLKSVCPIVRISVPESLSITGITLYATDSSGEIPIAGTGAIKPSSAYVNQAADVTTISIERGGGVISGDVYFCLFPNVEKQHGVFESSADALHFTFKTEGKWAKYEVSIDAENNPLSAVSVRDLGEIDPAKLLFKEIIPEEPDDPADDPVSAYGFDYTRLARMGHPRLLLTAEDVEGFRTRVSIQKDPDDLLYYMHQRAMMMAERQVATTDRFKDMYNKGTRMMTISRGALTRLFSCAYGYLFTKEQKYLDRVRTDIADILEFKSWNPSHFLDVGEMSMAISIVYDWMYDALTLEERIALHSALKKCALEKAPGQDFYSSIGNWNQVCNAGLTAAALAIYEKDKEISAGIIEKSVPSNIAAVKGQYNPDGNTHEGYGYWDYGASFQVMYLQMLQTAFGHCAGIDQIEGLKKTGPFILYMSGVCQMFSYADGGSNSKPAYNMPLWWIALNYNRPQDLVREMTYVRNNGYDKTSNRLFSSIPCFIYKHPFQIADVTYPSEQLWLGQGHCPVAMIRKGWNYDNTDVFVGFKGGSASAGHGHMDSGSFVYDAKGFRWSEDIDIGDYTIYESQLSTYKVSVQTALRWDVMRANNYFHSTLSFLNDDDTFGSGKVHINDQISGAVSEDVKFLSSYEREGDVAATLDLSPVYAGQAKQVNRTIRLVDNRDLYITDMIEAKDKTDAIVEWRMITAASVEMTDNTVVMNQGGYSLYLTADSDNAVAKPVLSSWEAERPDWWIDRKWDTSVEPSLSRYSIAGYKITIPAGQVARISVKLSFDKPRDPGVGESSGTVDGELPEFNDNVTVTW